MLKKRNPITPGSRWQRLSLNSLGSFKIRVKKLSSKLISKSGRSAGLSKLARFRCSRVKANYHHLPNLNEYLNVPATVISLFKVSYKTNMIAVIQYVNGSYTNMPLLHGIKIGSIINHIGPLSILSLFKSYRLFVGSIVEVRQLSRFSVISNISLGNDFVPKYARSAGTYCFLNEFLAEIGLCVIRLPSGIQKTLNLNSVAFLGRNSCISHRYSVLGKAGVNINKGKKQIVRGVAMNPVDHPNGGRTKTNKPEKSIWGWVAKRGM